MADATRDRRIVTMLGVIGMGKTVLTRFLVAQHRKAHPKAALIGLDKSRQFPWGEWPTDFSWSQKVQWDWVRSITNNSRGPPGPRVGKEGALIVLDDCDTYLRQFSSPWDDLWMSPRQMRTDIIASAHRPQGIPKELLNASSDLVIFWVGEVHANEYIGKLIGKELASQIPSPVEGDETGDSVRGLALWVKPRARRGEIVDVFKLAGINYKRPAFRRGAKHG